MRIGLFSDPHIHNWTQFGGKREREMPKRLQDQSKVLDQIIDAQVRYKLDVLGCGGDWFHRVGDHPTEVLQVSKSFFDRVKIPFFMVTGNHDLIAMEDPAWYQIATTFLPYKEFHVEHLPFKLALVNYYDKVNIGKLVGYDLVVIHQQPALTNDYGFAMEGLDWRTIAKNNRLVFFGHDHTNKQLAPNCFVIGSMMYLHFGDHGHKGMYVIDTDTWKLEFVPLVSPQFITVATPDLVQQDGNYYRVLKADSKVESANVISVVNAPEFVERIKTDDFREVLNEWAKIHERGPEALTVLDDVGLEATGVARKVFDGRLEEVTIEDFMSVGKVTYRLGDGFIFVAGNSEGDDTAESNGSGKTTMFGEAFFWGMTGETTKGLTGNDVIRRGCKDCMVKLMFRRQDGSRLEVTRTRKAGLSVVPISADGDAGKDMVTGMRVLDQQREFGELMGLGEDLAAVIKAGSYFSQENVVMLTGLTDQQRTGMLTELLGLSRYAAMQDRVDARQVYVNGQRADVVKQRAINERNVAVLEERVSAAQAYVERADARHKRLIVERDALREEIVKYAKELKEAEGILMAEDEDVTGRLDTVRTMIAMASDNIAEVDARITQADIRGKRTAIMAEIGRINEQADLKLCDLQDKERILTRDIATVEASCRVTEKRASRISEEIDTLRAKRTGVPCDVCGAMVTEENINAFIARREAQIKEFASEQDDLVKQAEQMRDELTGIQRAIAENRAQAKQAVQALQEKISDLQRDEIILSDERMQFDRKYRKLCEEEQALQATRRQQQQAREKREERVRSLKGMVESAGRMEIKTANDINDCAAERANAVQAVDEAVDGLTVAKKGLDVFDDQIKEHDRVIEILEFWKEAFSNRGIPVVMLDRFCNTFNRTVNYFLAQASSGRMSIVVSPTGMTKKGEERNKLTMAIRFDGSDVRYESLSGGEKRRVDVSLCLALNRWISTMYALPNGLFGYIIMDEMFSYLDAAGEEAIAQLLASESMNKSIVVISHTPELQSYARRVFVVRKKDGVSSIAEEVAYS